MLKIASASHEPIKHHINYMHSKASSPFVFAELSCGKAESIIAEFDVLVEPATWAQTLLDSASVALLANSDELDELQQLFVVGVELALCSHAGYFRRIVSEVVIFPHRAMRVAHSPADSVCELRRATAKEVLQSKEENMIKLKALCNDDLRYAVRTGMCKPMLYSIIRGWYEGGDATVEINEGHHSTIRKECTRSRHIGLDMLSARCNGKKELGLANGKKWSQCRQRAFAILQVRGPTTSLLVLLNY